MIQKELMDHYSNIILPYWSKLIDHKHGGFYGHVDYNLQVDVKSQKGVILNSRILWFYSSAYMHTGCSELKLYMEQAYNFLVNDCMDRKYGGVYWMLNYDKSISDNMKHTYNQAFAIYALSAYYEATKKKEALDEALSLFCLIEEKCTDDFGYLEAFSQKWKPIANEALSENGLLAEKTMNTLLHLLEAYTELYKVSENRKVKERLYDILKLFEDKVYDKENGKLHVFFDNEMKSISDLYSYGHDIEASWLLDRAAEIIGDAGMMKRTYAYTSVIAENIYQIAYDNDSVKNESFKAGVDETRVWWVQAEAIVGFCNAWQKTKNVKYLTAVKRIWNYVKQHMIQPQVGGEWFWEVNKEGNPIKEKPITEPWKCPYHNGRMCFEIKRRMENV